MALPVNFDQPLSRADREAARLAAAPLPWPATLRTLAAAVVILIFRRPEAILRPQFYADDGLFFIQAITAHREGGSGSLLLTPYMGYLNLGQRLLAWALGESVPVRWLPLAYALGGLGVALTVFALMCRYCRVELPGGSGTRALLVLAMLLLPHDGEAFLNVAAVQWLLAPLLVLLFLQRPAATVAQSLADAGLAAVAGLTGPMVPLVLPLLAVRWALHGRPRRGDAPFLAAALLTAAAQVWVVAHGTRAAVPALTHNWGRWMFAVGYQLPGRLFFGLQLPEMLGRAFWVLTPALVLLLGALCLAARDRRQRLLALAFLGTAAVFYTASIRPFGHDPRALHPLLAGARYFFVPYTMTLWALLLLRQTPGWPRRAADVLLGFALLSAATHFSWPDHTDFNWPETARSIERGERTAMRLPGPSPEGWVFVLDAPRQLPAPAPIPSP